MTKKCLALFSGGLDSILAVALLCGQNIEVLGIVFVSPFFSGSAAIRAAKQINIRLLTVDISEQLMAVIKNPRYGYGKNLNPCVDCHLLMLKTAAGYLKESGCSFVITGEVLGERPKSQNAGALKTIAAESGLEGYLLRPLSALLLEETIVEKKRWVKREKLLDLSGRSRKRQIELARHYNIKDYATPAGGCLLTDPSFSRRLKDSLAHGEDKLSDMELLKSGRHFRGEDNCKIIVGRDKADNKRLLQTADKEDLIFLVKDFPGPVVVLRGAKNDNCVKRAAGLAVRYSDSQSGKTAVVYGSKREGFNEEITVEGDLSRGNPV